jgi:hypothetical protein
VCYLIRTIGACAFLALFKCIYTFIPGQFRWLTQYHRYNARINNKKNLSYVNNLAAKFAMKFMDLYFVDSPHKKII